MEIVYFFLDGLLIYVFFNTFKHAQIDITQRVFLYGKDRFARERISDSTVIIAICQIFVLNKQLFSNIFLIAKKLLRFENRHYFTFS